MISRYLVLPLMLAGALFAQFSLADNVVHVSDKESLGSPVVTQPANPKAYEPFKVEFETNQRSPLPNDSGTIQLNDNNITLEYLGSSSGFPVPALVIMETMIGGLPAGTYNIRVAQRLERGEVNAGDSGIEIEVEEASPTTTAYTLFHPQRNRYFVTASPRQRDRSINNYGWHSADEGFNVWYPSNQAAPETAKPVCRFYSSEMNARYWTADQEECDSLKEPSSDWNYQGIVFQALVPTAGVCPTGTDPVWRLYNGRQNDSNYRFVTSNETYRTMVNDGWEGEGVKFCSPPDPESRESQ